MKKILILLLSVSCLTSILSCSKVGDSLVGTNWTSHTNGKAEIYELSFYTETKVEFSIIIDGKITETLYGTYDYMPPYVFFKLPNPEAPSSTVEPSAEIKGNQLIWETGIIFTRN